MNYTEWETMVSSKISDQVLWQIQLYRIASFATVLAEIDADFLTKHQGIIEVGCHLSHAVKLLKCQIATAHHSEYQSPAMISAYQQALLTTRRCKDWYYKGRQLLGERVTHHRLSFLHQIILFILARLPVSESIQHIRPNTSFSVIPENLLVEIPLP